jgi:hypothetical protein
MKATAEPAAREEKNHGAKGSKVTGNTRLPVKATAPTLAEQGISKREEVFHVDFSGTKLAGEWQMTILHVSVLDGTGYEGSAYTPGQPAETVE